MQNITDKMAKGAAWMVAFKIVERSIGLISTIILARLLEPEDFGLVAMATAFLGLMLLLSSFSFDVALIHNQSASRNLYDTAWTFNVLLSFFLAILLFLCAPIVADFYHDERLKKILYVLALGIFIGGFSNIGPVAFRKEMQFHKEFYFLLAKKLLGFTVCMILAFSMRNYWALVFGTFAGNFLEVILSYRVHPYRPRFCMSARRELFGFSLWLFINNTFFFAYHRIADFFISKQLGSHALGIYSIAYELSNLPTTELVAPINRAVLPGYSKMAGELSVLSQGFVNVLSIIALLAVPAGVGIVLVAEPLVEVVLGEKWSDAVPLMKLLALSGAITALQTNCSVIYNAVGKPRIMTLVLFLHLFILFFPMLVYFLQREGLLGVAYAYLYSNCIILPINYFFSMRILYLNVMRVFMVLWRPIVSVGIMFFITPFLVQLVIDGGLKLTNLTLLGLDILVGATLYVVSVIGLWSLSRFPAGAENYVIKKIVHLC